MSAKRRSSRVTCGLDVGSRTIGLAVLQGDRLIETALEETGRDPLARCRDMLEGHEGTPLLVTGYGRHLARDAFGAAVVTEITAVARGATFLEDDVGTVLDIGGQDSKIIALDGDGNPCDFRMNDRCAAGTGKYLEMMAQTMELDLEAFVALARSASRAETVTSVCAVYAESEMVSLLAAGRDAGALARGLHLAVVDRVEAMARQLECLPKRLFVGGVARNGALCDLLEARFGEAWHVPAEPQHVAALGAAVLARATGTQDWRLKR